VAEPVSTDAYLDAIALTVAVLQEDDDAIQAILTPPGQLDGLDHMARLFRAALKLWLREIMEEESAYTAEDMIDRLGDRRVRVLAEAGLM
jgi:hypothetical protein